MMEICFVQGDRPLHKYGVVSGSGQRLISLGGRITPLCGTEHRTLLLPSGPPLNTQRFGLRPSPSVVMGSHSTRFRVLGFYVGGTKTNKQGSCIPQVGSVRVDAWCPFDQTTVGTGDRREHLRVSTGRVGSGNSGRVLSLERSTSPLGKPVDMISRRRNRYFYLSVGYWWVSKFLQVVVLSFPVSTFIFRSVLDSCSLV